jgi:hypothetical protein
MAGRATVAGPLPCALLVLAGCHHAGDATAPCFAEPPDGTHQAALFPVTGGGACGTGGTSVTPFAVPERSFAAVIRFRVRGARPGTTYFVQRAPEVGRELGADRVCQRADGLPPWADGTPAFVTFPAPNAGPKVTLTTGSSGDGELEFEYRAPGIPAGAEFDVQMRLVDDESAPASELRSGCMTVLVR